MTSKKICDLFKGATVVVLTFVFIIVVMGLHLYSERGSMMSWLP